MKITILNSSEKHPINPWLEKWIVLNCKSHEIDLVRSTNELSGGDLLFLISCTQLVSKKDRSKFKKVLVIHASDLPKGRGWSPHVWEILQGANQITLALLEAEDNVDSGAIWKKLCMPIPKTALFNEINQILFDAELELMDFAVQNFECVIPKPQAETSASYWRKRTPQDSELDLNESLMSQFNLIRICDPQRFPAYFYIEGRKFILKVEAEDGKSY